MLLISASFVSGTMTWWGQWIQQEELTTPAWLRPALLVHGSLNPLLCLVFGALLCHHIRYGWQMRANLLTGLFIEAVFAGLILTGTGLYYIGSEWRDAVVLAHRTLGVLLPLSLALHWIFGLKWARQVISPPQNPGSAAP